MWKYYFALFREIPRFFRGTVEAWVFWGVGAGSIIGVLWPDIAALEQSLAVPRWIGPVSLGAVVVYGMLRVNYDHIRAARTRISEMAALPSDKYSVLCALQQELNSILRKHFLPSASLYSDSAAFWQRVESELYPYLHEDERTHLRELFHHPTAWQMSSFAGGTYDPATDMTFGQSAQQVPSPNEVQQSKAALHALKNALDSWAMRDRPLTLPSGK